MKANKKIISKRIIALVLLIVTVVSAFSITPVNSFAAGRGSWANAFDVPTDSRFAKCYTIATSGQTPVYRSRYLTNANRGTITYGFSRTAHIDNATDELYLKDAGTTGGYTWAKVNFPIGRGKRADGYIYLSALTCAKYSKSHLYYASSLGTFYCSPRCGGSLNRNYYVSRGETVYAIALYGNQVQILYPNGAGKWRIAYCSRSDANKYLDGNSTNGGSSSPSFTQRTTAPASNNKYFYSSINPFYRCGYAGQCTWYAYGRAYEILGSAPKLCTGNAKDWYGYNKRNGYYSYGSTPKVGAIVCWSCGSCGHVGIVEKVISNTNVYISEANVAGGKFRYRNYNPTTWNSGFQGYIYII